MPLISLRLADFENCQRDYLVLAEKIPASALDLAMTESLHFVLDGGGQLLQDGAHAYGYSFQGGTILNVVAVSSEPGPASVLEVVGHGVLSMSGSRADADLAEWDTTLRARSVIEVRQVSTLSNARKIDCWIVILSAGIC